MSGRGAPVLDPPAAATGLRVAVVAASWHAEVMAGLLTGARGALDAAGARRTEFRVPGSFELPVVCARLAAGGEYDAVVALGVVVRGGTPHFDYVCRAAVDGLARVALDHGVPVGMGVLTCDTDEQARQRAGLTPPSGDGPAGNHGEQAANAALATAAVLRHC